MNRTMPCLQMNKLYILGSWSQCMRKNERGLSMNRNSQTRMTNDEIRRNDETRMTKPMTAQLRAFGHSSFGFLSSFVIRHSSTYANQVHGPNACTKRKRALREPSRLMGVFPRPAR